MTTPSTSRIRSPLIPKPNEQNVQPNSKVLINHPGKQIRRKPSTNRLIDSSESDPSSHSSIFEALYFSPTTSDSSSNRYELWPMVSLKRGQLERSSIRPILTNENVSGEMSAMEFATRTIEDLLGSTPIIYGKGTALETIIEQKSHSTMSISRTKSYDDLHASLHQKSMDLVYTVNNKASFSVDDLSLIKSSYHEALSAIEKIPLTIGRQQNIYAGPKKPIQPPPDRPSTPPGMPSWTEAQAEAARRIRQRESRRRAVSAPQHRNRFIRWVSYELSRSSDPASGSNSHRSHATPHVHRFRAPRNIHGDITNHPFHHAPIAQVKPLTARSHIVPEAEVSNAPGPSGSSPGLSLHRVHAARSIGSNDIGNAMDIIQRPVLPVTCNHITGDNSAVLPPASMQGGYTAILSHSLMRNSLRGISAAQMEAQVTTCRACWRCRFKYVGAMVKYCLQKSLAFCCYVFCGIEWDEAEQMVVR